MPDRYHGKIFHRFTTVSTAVRSGSPISIARFSRSEISDRDPSHSRRFRHRIGMHFASPEHFEIRGCQRSRRYDNGCTHGIKDTRIFFRMQQRGHGFRMRCSHMRLSREGTRPCFP